ncbi:hypothetical protein CROQUDRAFT_356454 [Cronartium quercuum f. sp. fusiforme G11]|uniref:HAT C-terminal dimerisation domain-containing protein n=1 Tax=Cronartium quercuum f. sp. fusiforme G11 TaxID=708437 RepID=A0A9P6N6G3_9BASI|nr:hypothetical protein CROQUDRAFT_356454 [Cronartium quercuum f. sp. fusiforme G11]
MGHVINLAAKTGLKAFGGVNTEDAPSFDYLDVDQNSIPVSPENLITITNRLRGLAIHVENTPQQKDYFIHTAKVIGITAPPIGLIHDHSARWNSAYQMFTRALQLRTAINFCCEQDPNLRQYMLSNAEWNKASLTYEWVVRRTDAAAADYATEGLLAPLQFMKKTLDDYQRHILLKPVYLCSVILDPRSKMKELDSTTLSAAQKTPEEMKAFFIKAAEAFSSYNSNNEINQQQKDEDETKPLQEENESDDESDGPRRLRKRIKISDLNTEIETYLTNEVEDPQISLSLFWSRKKDLYPTLEFMARSYLSVTSTSSPSNRIFKINDNQILNESNRIPSIKTDNWEPLMYLKSWSESGLI